MYQAILIKQDVKQPKWAGPAGNFVKGVYAINFELNNLRKSIFAKNPCTITGEFGEFSKFTTHMERGTKPWLQAMMLGNITFDEPRVTIIGRFEKRGVDVFFVPEQEEHYDSPY